VVDDTTGEVLDGDVVWDDRFWGAVLATKDESTAEARAHVRELWYAGCGCDPDLVPEAWWQLYHDAADDDVLVPVRDLPETARPGALAHFDLESMKVTDVYDFADGSFPSPPTFVPRTGPDTEPGDGYVVVLVHRDGPKEVQVFDAHDLGRGPLARATAEGFNPNLLLHSCWMPPRAGARPSRYRVPVRRDVTGALRGLPAVLREMATTTRAIRRRMKEEPAAGA
ncbi:MAG: carotenoid oxygenase family protein, partial [Acidimicrobiales bacterium]